MPTAEINNHKMYYEIHGDGPPAICMGGWGTYCHGGERHLARGLTDAYSVLIIDYRGIGESDDDLSVEPSMDLYADDVIGLLEHLDWTDVHFVGLVGMGACISQIVAIKRPDLVRSMVNMGAWARCDDFLADQLRLFSDVHRDSGFYAFQKFVTVMSFLPEYYNAHKDKLLGPDGGWKELNGRQEAHARFVQACIAHDVADRLDRIEAPSLIIHAGRDLVTSPRTTLPLEEGIPNARGVMMEDVAHVVAGKDQKIRFCDTLLPFLAEH
ncbi:alpha/beta fold hydrolase [Lentisalinibacter sediminis]|uniref:alpha/beta fold hydrolase n=1 Tax=Lentisalinibacter sediminis TaxID=2992237 RepID=UPI0038657638